MKQRLPILALLAAALLLRLYRLNDGLWYDEIGTWIRYMHLPLAQIPFVYGSENQHFLFSILARASLLVFGESNWAFRLPAALFGVASIWSTWWMARMVTTPREAFFSAALLTFSYHHVWFSQNARGYSGLLFWTMLASGFLIRGLEGNTRRDWLLWAVCAALGVYTHATMSFVLIAHALIALAYCTRKGGWLRVGSWFGLGATLTLLLHAPALPEIRAGLKGTISVVNEWKSPLWTIAEIFRGLSVNFAGAAALVVVGLVALAVFFTGLASYLRSRPVVAALLVLPSLIGGGLVFSLGHHIWPRFFYFAFGFAVLVVVRGVDRLASSIHPRLALPAVVAMVLVSAVSLRNVYGPKQDFVGALAYAQGQAAPGDVIASADLASNIYTKYLPGPVPLRTRDDLFAARQGHRVFLLYTLTPVFRAQLPELYETVTRDAASFRRFPGTLKDGAITVAEFAPLPEPTARP
ncbi:MAG: glycosyltransferase family 39 protein [Acidobacteriota bacterium]